ncbi:flagellar hook capping FlgD N-terminal domain-containing protein [Terrarubrum flagellatum]|uniref:flagellar hook capping FlgD N-terminal domain-containing protein n=1 Tax=Terrirubrum flagellatum TaxID=2895980 RepID=UPI003144E010
MSVSAITSASLATTSSASASSSSSSSSLSGDDFLQLLVEQLKNQNPLDPSDSNEMVNQLMSYASYDTQSSMNSTLSELSSTLTSMNSTLSGIASNLNVSV